jgi:hypothetical protein
MRRRVVSACHRLGGSTGVETNPAWHGAPGSPVSLCEFAGAMSSAVTEDAYSVTGSSTASGTTREAALAKITTADGKAPKAAGDGARTRRRLGGHSCHQQVDSAARGAVCPTYGHCPSRHCSVAHCAAPARRVQDRRMSRPSFWTPESGGTRKPLTARIFLNDAHVEICAISAALAAEEQAEVDQHEEQPPAAHGLCRTYHLQSDHARRSVGQTGRGSRVSEGYV